MHQLLKNLKNSILHHATSTLSIRIQIALLVIIIPLLLNTILPTNIVYVHTPSIPMGFYLSKPIQPQHLTHHSTVCFHASPPPWIQERLYFGPQPANVCKRIAAIPNDLATLSINTALPPSQTPSGILPHLQVTLTSPSNTPLHTLPLLQYDSKNRPIPQQTLWENPSTIQPPSQSPPTTSPPLTTTTPTSAPSLPLNTPTPIPNNYYFLIGDIPNSLDSRYFGPIPSSSIYSSITPLWLI